MVSPFNLISKRCDELLVFRAPISLSEWRGASGDSYKAGCERCSNVYQTPWEYDRRWRKDWSQWWNREGVGRNRIWAGREGTGFPHCPKAECFHEIFRKPNGLKQKKSRWSTDAPRHSSGLWRLDAECGFWGRSLAGLLPLPGCTLPPGQLPAKLTQHAVFPFPPLSWKQKPSLDSFQFGKTGANVGFSRKQSGIKFIFKKQRMPVLEKGHSQKKDGHLGTKAWKAGEQFDEHGVGDKTGRTGEPFHTRLNMYFILMHWDETFCAKATVFVFFRKSTLAAAYPLMKSLNLLCQVFRPAKVFQHHKNLHELLKKLLCKSNVYIQNIAMSVQ